MVSSCFVWIVYGLLKGEPTIYATNLVEFTLSTYYFVEFTNYAPSHSPTFPGSVYQHIKLVLGIWTISIFVAIFFKDSVSMIGDLTVFLTITTFASPLAAVKAVFESQTSESIPWPFTLTALLNCCLWTIVGVAEMHDYYVYFPAVLGLIFALLQVALKLYFGDHANNNNQDNSMYARAPVEMPYPVLGSVRQVVMFGNNFPAESDNLSSSGYNPLTAMEDHELQLDMNGPSSSSKTDYVELGVDKSSGESHYNHHEGHHQQLSQQRMITPVSGTSPAIGFAQATPTFHKHNKSDEGLENVVLDENTSNSTPSFPMHDSFRSRSSSSGPQQQQQQHVHGL